MTIKRDMLTYQKLVTQLRQENKALEEERDAAIRACESLSYCICGCCIEAANRAKHERGTIAACLCAHNNSTYCSCGFCEAVSQLHIAQHWRDVFKTERRSFLTQRDALYEALEAVDFTGYISLLEHTGDRVAASVADALRVNRAQARDALAAARGDA